jgi:hypothetical protein
MLLCALNRFCDRGEHIITKLYSSVCENDTFQRRKYRMSALQQVNLTSIEEDLMWADFMVAICYIAPLNAATHRPIVMYEYITRI